MLHVDLVTQLSSQTNTPQTQEAIGLMMAYVPPHKRHSQGKLRPAPTSEMLVPRFQRGLSVRSPVSNANKMGKFVYGVGDHAINNWYAVELDCGGHLPNHAHLEPVSVEAFEQRIGGKPLMLVNINPSEDNATGTPWDTVAEKVLQDLQSSFEILMNETDNKGLDQIKPTLVARFGNILFHQTSSVGTIVSGQLEEAELRQLRRSFYTNIPSSYLQNVEDKVVPKLGLDFEDEKEIYHVKLYDKTRRDSTISCKCNVTNDKSLMLYKVKLNAVRHMVNDISCLDKDLDLRIMLCRKRIVGGLSENELNSIRGLTNSAVLDSDVRGGLRWPLGTSSGDRFAVLGVWHVTAKTYKNQSVRLKVRHADRFDFRSGIREVTREVTVKLKKVVSLLQEHKATDDTVSEILKDNVKLIWDNFLCCEQFLK